ncbi:MAG TPA: hypothetical protein VGY58_09085 [Gemmataceae bacterium]|jgi:hypothetical protein|nr:hypothetical protein [Gemmataceae bacterium]
MTCPPEIASVIVDILRTGLLSIRSAAWAGDAQRCAIEADHIHNLPDLLNNYSDELLSFYWHVSREAFIKETPGELSSLQPLWQRLHNLGRLTPHEYEKIA